MMWHRGTYIHIIDKYSCFIYSHSDSHTPIQSLLAVNCGSGGLKSWPATIPRHTDHFITLLCDFCGAIRVSFAIKLCLVYLLHRTMADGGVGDGGGVMVTALAFSDQCQSPLAMGGYRVRVDTMRPPLNRLYNRIQCHTHTHTHIPHTPHTLSVHMPPTQPSRCGR